MSCSNPQSKQIQNRNYLTATGFKFILAKYPKIDFLSNSVQIPSVNLGVAIQSTYLKDIPIPGDKLTYDEFTLEFLVDEEMENYLTIHNWIRGLGYPETVKEYADLIFNDPITPGIFNAYSGEANASLLVYNSNFNPITEIKFQGLFPVSLSAVGFDSRDAQSNYITATATFKYTIYDIIKL